MSMKISELRGGHEGYAAPMLPDGSRTRDPAAGVPEFTGYYAACACGWTGGPEFPPTEAGRREAEEHWRDAHARVLILSTDEDVPRDLAAKSKVLSGQIARLIGSRPTSALRTLAQVDRWHQELTVRAVAAARTQGSSWADVGAALGISKQAAHERFRSHLDS